MLEVRLHSMENNGIDQIKVFVCTLTRNHGFVLTTDTDRNVQKRIFVR
jgi:hypothetical protein